MAIIFITHDLGVVSEICDKIIVMYAGKVVEEGMSRQIFYERCHPYTEGLLASVPKLDSDVSEKLSPSRETAGYERGETRAVPLLPAAAVR